MIKSKTTQNRADSNPSPIRVALYSHDTQGLGHIRRNMAIAQALQAGDLPLSILLISGTQLGGAFELPQNSDILSLPAVEKEADGQYHAKSLPMSLEDVVALRKNTICGALRAFKPHILIVDKVPAGFCNELMPSLKMLQRNGMTRCVLGLRDILDDPETTRADWRQSHAERVIADYYAAVWVYGDPQVYNLVEEYGLDGELAAKVRFTGYLDRSNGDRSNGQNREKLPASAKSNSARPRAQTNRPAVAAQKILCMLGGGQDGIALANAFLQAQFPPDASVTLLTGPYLPEAAFARLTARVAALQEKQANVTIEVIRFTVNPAALLREADIVISMGGYNSVCEILAHGKRALIVPRVEPRLEQWVRAQRLQELGYLDLIHPQELTPAALTAWMATASSRTFASTTAIDLAGLSRLPQHLADVINQPVRKSSSAQSAPPGRAPRLPLQPQTNGHRAIPYLLATHPGSADVVSHK